jgi:hypothetical protein
VPVLLWARNYAWECFVCLQELWLPEETISFISYSSLLGLDTDVSEKHVSSVINVDKQGSQPLSPPIVLSGKVSGSQPAQSNRILTQTRLYSTPAWNSSLEPCIFWQHIPLKRLFQPTTLYGVTGILEITDVPRNFFGRRGFQQIQLRTEDRENGELGAVAP